MRKEIQNHKEQAKEHAQYQGREAEQQAHLNMADQLQQDLAAHSENKPEKATYVAPGQQVPMDKDGNPVGIDIGGKSLEAKSDKQLGQERRTINRQQLASGMKQALMGALPIFGTTIGLGMARPPSGSSLAKYGNIS